MLIHNEAKRAFTLAEVLLTLAIIGVVAALTIPAIVTKATKQQYVTGVKKAFNTLKSVEREAIREHGKIENWNWAGGGSGGTSALQRDFDTYIKKYLDVVKDCKLQTTDCFASEYKRLDSATANMVINNNQPAVITSDGMAFKYSIYTNGGVDRSIMIIDVDINGKKGPNIRGRDLFSFDIINADTETSNLKPSGSYAYVSTNPELIIRPATTEEVVKSCSVQSDQTSQDWGCTARVLSENGMNY